MAKQLQKKFIGNDQVDSTKIKLLQDQAIRGTDSQGNEQDLIKLDGSDKVLIKGEEAALKSQIDAEQSARESADSALDARLDIIEGADTVVGSIAKAEKDAKAYTDQKVADLVDSAPELLNTLNELAAAIGDDPNFVTTVVNSVATVQTNLNTEIANRIADVDAEQSRAEGVEASLQSQITQEVSDRQNAITAVEDALDVEISDRLTAEAGLQSQIDALSGSSGSSLAALEAALTQEVSDRIADVNAEETRAMGVESSLQSQITQEISDRQFAVSSEESRAMGVESSLQSQITQEISDRQNAVSSEETRAMSVESSLQSQITQEISDRISDVNAEESRAMGVESSLQSQITQEIADRISDVNAEETRAMAAESALDVRVDVLEAKAFYKHKVTLTSTDVSNGYVDLPHLATVNSIHGFVDRLAIHEGSSEDYTVSTVGGVSRITFLNELVAPGKSSLSVGDEVYFKYHA
jgi:hypothetical protein